MIHVEWHPKWKAADLHAHVQAFKQERLEQTVDPLNDEVDLDNLVNQGFEGNPRSLSDSSWLSTTGCAICKNVTFDSNLPTPRQISCHHGNVILALEVLTS
eukprot:1149385-Pelagomonas_calceolata.AAC.4